jgi:hypothetical protein
MREGDGWSFASNLELPEDTRDYLARTVIKNSEWELVAGGHAPTYYDLDELFSRADGQEHNKRLLDLTIERIKELQAEHGYASLAFIEELRGPTGVLPARLSLSEATGLPSLILRPYKRLLSQAVKPFRQPPMPVLIVTDVATTGRTIADAADLLGRLGVRGCGTLAVFDRQEGAADYVSSMGIAFHWVVRPPVAA